MACNAGFCDTCTSWRDKGPIPSSIPMQNTVMTARTSSPPAARLLEKQHALLPSVHGQPWEQTCGFRDLSSSGRQLVAVPSPPSLSDTPTLIQSARPHCPETNASFMHLHNMVAMPLMRRTETLASAYRCLCEANALHVRVHGRPSREALYNMACCLSMGAAALYAYGSLSRAHFNDVTVGLPPFSAAHTAQELAEGRFDCAAVVLDAAVDAGYADVANLSSDPDIAALREHRPRRFAAVRNRALAMAARPTLSRAGANPPLPVASVPLLAQSPAPVRTAAPSLRVQPTITTPPFGHGPVWCFFPTARA